MKVINLQAASDSRCNCDTWLDHWKNFSEQNISTCVVINCDNNAEVGGHVKQINIIRDNWYIIPLCKKCNNRRYDILDISESVIFVPANIAKTCGR